MHREKTAPTCPTLQVTELKGPWLLFPVPSLLKTHCCSQETQTKPNQTTGRVSAHSRKVPQTQCSALQRPSETSPFQRVLYRAAGVLAGDAAPALHVPTPVPMAGKAPRGHLCSPETKQKVHSHPRKASVFRLVCTHKGTTLLCHALPSDNFHGELKQVLSHIYLPQIPKSTWMVREGTCRRADTGRHSASRPGDSAHREGAGTQRLLALLQNPGLCTSLGTA